MSGDFRRGATVELCVNAHAIPAGSYQYLGEEGELLLFSIGGDVLFGLAKPHWAPFLRSVPGKNRRRTSKRDFVSRYYELLDDLQPQEVSPSTLTFCALSPHLMERRGQRLSPRWPKVA